MPGTVAPNTQVEIYLDLIRAALGRIIAHLGGSHPEGASLAQLYTALDARRQALGSWKAVGEALGVPEKYADEALTRCVASLRLARSVEEQLSRGAAPAGRNEELLLLRLLNQLERVTENKPEIGVRAGLPEPDNAALLRSQQQVRALELVIRSLVTQAYGSQERLRDEMVAWLGSERVQQWSSSADSGDLLSGTSFGELAGLYVNKKEYPQHYEKFYLNTPYLQLLANQRTTLADFLEDIRGIRNQIAHHKRISPVQMALLGAYYDEVIEPVQQAYDKSGEGVNPDRYFDVSSAQLNDYFDKVGQRLDQFGDQLVSVLEEVQEISRKVDQVHGVVKDVQGTVQETGARVTEIGADTRATRTTVTDIGTQTERSGKRLKQVLAGVALLLAAAAATLYLSTGAKKETSADPRKELANRGLVWRPQELRGVIETGDVESARLFLQGGMKWNTYFAYKPLDRDDQPMLALLQDYPKLLLREDGDCGSLMSHLTRTEPGSRRNDDNGRSERPHRLTSAERSMLKLVCNQPEDLAKARQEAEQAAAAYRSQVEAYNKEKAAIQPAAQCIAELSQNNYRGLLDEVTAFSPFMGSSILRTRRNRMLAELYPAMATGTLDKAKVAGEVSKYCNEVAADEPNIDLSESYSLSKKQILDVLR